MSFLGGLFGGGGDAARAEVYNPDPNAFKIKDAEKYRGEADTQYKSSVERGDFVAPKQENLINSLEMQANGQGPSLATEQLKSATNRNLAQQLALAQASRSPNGALNQRNLMKNQATAGAQLAEVGAQARMQEQQNARNLLANQLNNQQASADQLTQHYLAQGFSIAQAQQQALADLEKLKAGQTIAANQANAGIDASNAQLNFAGAQNLFKTISSGAMAAMGGGGGAAKPNSAGGGTGAGSMA